MGTPVCRMNAWRKVAPDSGASDRTLPEASGNPSENVMHAGNTNMHPKTQNWPPTTSGDPRGRSPDSNALHKCDRHVPTWQTGQTDLGYVCTKR